MNKSFLAQCDEARKAYVHDSLEENKVLPVMLWRHLF